MPAEFAKIERYPGSVVVGRVDAPTHLERAYYSHANDETVLAHYETQFAGNGWRHRYTRSYQEDGRLACYEKDGLRAEVIAWSGNARAWDHLVDIEYSAHC